jgi:hypothetical protein
MAGNPRSRARTVLRYLTIVPQAHYSVLDRDLQTALYELFHTHPISRVGHAVCTPIVCISALAALARIGLPLHAPALVFAALLSVNGFLYGVGVLTTTVVAMMTLGATLFGGVPHALVLSLAMMLLAGALQTWSHAFEPVPPPLSGQPGFLSAGVWRSQSSPGRKLAAVALSMTAFVALELLASFRILPCQLRAYTLASSSDRTAVDRRVAELRAAWPY